MSRAILFWCVVSSALAICGTARGEPIYFTDESSFDAAINGKTLAVEDFEQSSVVGSTVPFGGGSVSCVGTVWCPSFFGVRDSVGTDGLRTVYFASPDTITFLFDQPINAFSIDVIGVGTQGSTTFSMLDSNGNQQDLLVDYVYPSGGLATTPLFFGVIDFNNSFTSVSFTGTAYGDGIEFDRLRYGITGEVAEPGTLALLSLGLAGLATLRPRKAVVCKAPRRSVSAGAAAINGFTIRRPWPRTRLFSSAEPASAERYAVAWASADCCPAPPSRPPHVCPTS